MILLAKVGLGLASAAVAGAGLLCSEGFVSVKVDKRGPDPHRVRIIAPALLVPAAAYIASRQIHMDRDIKELLPVAQTAAAALADTDDVTLAQIDDRNEHVRIEKRFDNIVIDVDAPDATVHISLPLRAVNSTLNALVVR